MKCTKILIFTFPSAFTANGIPFQPYFSETLIQHERRDLGCFESDSTRLKPTNIWKFSQN